MLYDKRGIYVGYEMDDEREDHFEHYGTPRHSGRYPWGSGENPYQRNADFLGQVEKLKRQKGPDGKPMFNEVQIAKSMNMNTSELRKRISLARAENRAYEVSEYKKLKAKGMSRSAIARRMGINESTLRNYDNEEINDRMTKNAKNAKILKDRVDEVGFVQVGAGAEFYLNNASSTSLNNTLKMLENEGYSIHNIGVPQLGTGKVTTVKVLTAPGVEKKDVYKNLDKIRMPVDIYMEDGEIKKAKEYVSVDPKRIQVVYAEQGGKDKDGLIEVRRNVPDLDLGRNHYVQGRILVNGDHYLKGMVAYADDLPPGVDIRFNTNKHEGTPMFNYDNPKGESVLKPIKQNQENIFGANIKPDEKLVRAHRTYFDEDGNEHQSAINIVKEEGDVDSWTKNLASQFLSKQSPNLAKGQLKVTYDIAKAEFDEIAAYTNPVVKAKMLEDFAGRCERDAVHMAAAALPRQKSKFLMPLTNVKDDEAYLPGFDDGEFVALVRYPHGSISEIPIVRVNNTNRKAKAYLGEAIDAIGVSPKTADRLSGADFDGDTVIAIPMSSARIQNSPQFEGLKNYDHRELYKEYPGMTRMTKHQHGVEMGKISNLLTDMTLQKAPRDEIERALKQSMVVVDAEKHHLNWRQAELDNGIAELRRKYQNGGGASTLLSRSTAQEHIPERKLKMPGKMSPSELERWKAGEDIYVETGRQRRDITYPKARMTPQEKADYTSGDPTKKIMVERAMRADGRARVKYETATEKSKSGYLHDPFELASTQNRETTTPMERIYGDHSRRMKELAKEARALARAQESPKEDKEAKKKYAREVESLTEKINVAKKNAPLEKQAQIIANTKYKAWKWDHPEEDAEHQKRQKGIYLEAARKAVGAKKLQIGTKDNPLTPKEWEAIQAHAISSSKLRDILNNADMKVVRSYAMPRTKTGMIPAKVSRAKAMLRSGYSYAEIADALDVSDTTIINTLTAEGVI